LKILIFFCVKTQKRSEALCRKGLPDFDFEKIAKNDALFFDFPIFCVLWSDFVV
jgi:hypothetical protein